MPISNPLPLTICALGLFWIFLGTGRAQETAPPPSLEDLQTRLAEIEENTQLEETAKAELEETYKQAIQILQETQENRETAASYREILKTAPEKIQRLTEQAQAISKKLAETETGFELLTQETKNLPLEEVEQRIAMERAALAELSAELLEAEDELLRLESSRQEEIQTELKVARQKVAEAENALEEFKPDASRRAQSEAQKALLQAQLAQAQSEVEKLQEEQLSFEQRLALTMAQRDLLARQQEEANARLNALEKLALQKRRDMAQETRETAEKAQTEAEGKNREVQAFADQLTESSEQFQEVTERIAAVSAQRQRAEKQLQNLADNLTNIRKQLAIGGAGDAFARTLLQELRNLPKPGNYRRKLADLRSELTTARANAFTLNKELQQPPPPGASEELVEQRKKLLTELRDAYRRLIEDLVALSATQREALEKTEEFRDYLSQQLFWVASSRPVSLTTFQNLPAALWALVDPAELKRLGRSTVNVLLTSPLRALLVLILVTLLFWFRPRGVARLEALGLRTRRISQDSWALTWTALGITVLLAMPFPILMAYLGLQLYFGGEASNWLTGFSLGLLWASAALFAFQFFVETARRNGLGEAHFEWNGQRLRKLRGNLKRLACGYIFLIFVILLLLHLESPEHLDSLGRLCFVAAMVWSSLILKRALHPEKGIAAGYLAKNPEGWWAKLRKVWFFLVVASPLILAGLALAGYFLTALALNFQIQFTACWLAGGPVIYGLLFRGISVPHRKMALQQLIEERREKREAAHASKEKPADTNDEKPVVEEEDDDIDLESISTQSKSLLRFLVSIGVAVGIWFAWAGAIPIFQHLDSFTPVGNISLADLLAAILAAIATVVASRNLPGLLELAVLRNLPLDAGSRSAMMTLVRYVLVAVGLAFVFQFLEVDWSKFGWILAALSVGLGFGLQEVVANFVCGIIVLFERPIRVGDTVTVADVTGVVSRIQMRATTITDWDRKEFVVPNKEFVTGTLMNWTLSNPVNRVVIPVGVAYGTDIEKAREILLKVAREHPRVLEDPGPLATFELFGDSSLNLVLRCYLPNLDNRLGTIHELHTAVNNEFNAAGVEISFPQRDLHLRSVDSGIRFAGGGKEESS